MALPFGVQQTPTSHLGFSSFLHGLTQQLQQKYMENIQMELAQRQQEHELASALIGAGAQSGNPELVAHGMTMLTSKPGKHGFNFLMKGAQQPQYKDLQGLVAQMMGKQPRQIPDPSQKESGVEGILQGLGGGKGPGGTTFGTSPQFGGGIPGPMASGAFGGGGMGGNWSNPFQALGGQGQAGMPPPSMPPPQMPPQPGSMAQPDQPMIPTNQ